MTETQNTNSFKDGIDEVIEATSLTNAKRIASRKQFFQGTVINLFTDDNQENLVARKSNSSWEVM